MDAHVPPEGTPPPPPPPFTEPPTTYVPPPPTGSGNALPWERPGAGIGEFAQTVQLIFTRPTEAFQRLSLNAPLWRPIVFAVVCLYLNILFGAVYEAMFRGTIEQFMPEAFAQYDYSAGTALVATAVCGPFLAIIVLLAGAALQHLALRLAGDGGAGFLGTLRATAYATAPGLLGILPICGGLAAAVWQLVLMVIGFSTVHRTDKTRVIIALAILFLFFCCCCSVPIIFVLKQMKGMPF